MVFSVDSAETAGLTVFDLSAEANLESLDEFEGVSDRAAVCSGVARQVAEGQDIEDIKDCYSDFDVYIEETYVYLKEEGQLNDPDIESVFYNTMLEIVESALFG